MDFFSLENLPYADIDFRNEPSLAMLKRVHDDELERVFKGLARAIVCNHCAERKDKVVVQSLSPHLFQYRNNLGSLVWIAKYLPDIVGVDGEAACAWYLARYKAAFPEFEIKIEPSGLRAYDYKVYVHV